MFYTYALKSRHDGALYIGSTKNLKERLKSHNAGYVESTKRRLPMDLIYYEACLNRSDASRREKYLKTSYGKRYLKSRLREYFTG